MITLKEEMFAKELVLRLLFHCLLIHIAQILDMSKNEEKRLLMATFTRNYRRKDCEFNQNSRSFLPQSFLPLRCENLLHHWVEYIIAFYVFLVFDLLWRNLGNDFNEYCSIYFETYFAKMRE